jgi:hypothetical protein
LLESITRVYNVRNLDRDYGREKLQKLKIIFVLIWEKNITSNDRINETERRKTMYDPTGFTIVFVNIPNHTRGDCFSPYNTFFN